MIERGRLSRQYERSARAVAQWPMWMRDMLEAAKARERMTTPLGDEIDRLRAEVARLEATVLELSEQKESLASELAKAQERIDQLAEELEEKKSVGWAISKERDEWRTRYEASQDALKETMADARSNAEERDEWRTRAERAEKLIRSWCPGCIVKTFPSEE